MKKTVVGLVALGGIVGLLTMATRLSRRIREHSGKMAAMCTQMAGQCKEMATRFEDRGEAAGRT